MVRSIALRGRRVIANLPYKLLDPVYSYLDKKHIRRSRSLAHIPAERNRRGGKYSYAEWGHVIGIFQTLMYLHLERASGNRILDIGCGTGLLSIASDPFVSGGGHYTGIDVSRRDIAFCQGHFDPQRFSFVHLDVANTAYAAGQQNSLKPWPVEDSSFDMVTALSVWTHMKEDEALFYLSEVQRVLRPGGTAIITVFLLDEAYRQSLSARSARPGAYHMTMQDQWIFSQPAYGSDAWFCPAWASRVPELAIGITPAGLDRLLQRSGLELAASHPGNWKEAPGLYFQDVLVLKKQP
jgi:SAM-dependent methyltransferase